MNNTENTFNKIKNQFIRERECHKLTGLSRTTRWRLERDKKFPLRRQLSQNTVGWLWSEVDDWISSRASKANVSGENTGSES